MDPRNLRAWATLRDCVSLKTVPIDETRSRDWADLDRTTLTLLSRIRELDDEEIERILWAGRLLNVEPEEPKPAP